MKLSKQISFVLWLSLLLVIGELFFFNVQAYSLGRGRRFDRNSQRNYPTENRVTREGGGGGDSGDWDFTVTMAPYKVKVC